MELFVGDRAEFDHNGEVVTGTIQSQRGRRWLLLDDKGGGWRVNPYSLRETKTQAPAAKKAWKRGDRVEFTDRSGNVKVGTVTKADDIVVFVASDDGKYKYRVAPGVLQETKVPLPKYEGPVYLPGTRVVVIHAGKRLPGTVKALEIGNRAVVDLDDGRRWKGALSSLREAS